MPEELDFGLTISNRAGNLENANYKISSSEKYKNLGFNFRYIFAKMDKTKNNPFFNAIMGRVTFYFKPIITIGINRNILILTCPCQINDISHRPDLINCFF